MRRGNTAKRVGVINGGIEPALARRALLEQGTSCGISRHRGDPAH